MLRMKGFSLAMLFGISCLASLSLVLGVIRMISNPPSIEAARERCFSEIAHKNPSPAAAAGFCHGFADAEVQGRMLFFWTQVVLGLIGVGYAIAILRVMRKEDNAELVSKIGKCACIPILSPGVILGIPFGILLLVAQAREKAKALNT